MVHTSVLEIAYEDDGPRDGSVVMLLHGWPDAPRGWHGVAQALQAAGWRTIVPYLRGSPPTRFLSQDTPRVGAAVALAQDAIDLADALGLERFAVVGHDWGARTADAVHPDDLPRVLAAQSRSLERLLKTSAGELEDSFHLTIQAIHLIP